MEHYKSQEDLRHALADVKAVNESTNILWKKHTKHSSQATSERYEREMSKVE